MLLNRLSGPKMNADGAIRNAFALAKRQAKSNSKVSAKLTMSEVMVTCGLLFVLLVSSLGVVYSSHLCRQLFAEHAELVEKKDSLQLEWAQLLLEQGVWSGLTRIESKARGELEMALPAQADTYFLPKEG